MTIRRFRVSVDGETFEVEVEEIASPRPSPPPLVPPPAAVPPAAVPPAAVSPPPGPVVGSGPVVGPGPGRAAAPPRTGRTQPAGGERVDAPLPGTVVSVPVQPEQSVKAGQTLAVLEAMKMQNEIVSPRDGRVREVLVKKGDTVAVGDALVTLE